jgi:lysophospholipase L1-like esterase
LPGTAIPSKSYGEVYPPANSALPNKIGHKRGDGNTFLIFSEGRYFHDLQVAVTYTHAANAWNGIVPGHAGSNLPKLMAKLQAKAPVTICQSGDSISFGANASGMINAPPFLPSYGELVALGLEKNYGSKINLRNFAIGGWQSQNGVADAGAVAAEKPDLVIIAYGMNDAFGVSTATYIANINAIINKVRETSPDAEFILVASMLPNAEWHALNMGSFATYRDALAAACGTGVVLADMTSVWEELLKRKSFLDITGNGVNHPNDFGHRLYGQVILQLISNEN